MNSNIRWIYRGFIGPHVDILNPLYSMQDAFMEFENAQFINERTKIDQGNELKEYCEIIKNHTDPEVAKCAVDTIINIKRLNKKRGYSED